MVGSVLEPGAEGPWPAHSEPRPPLFSPGDPQPPSSLREAGGLESEQGDFPLVKEHGLLSRLPASPLNSQSPDLSSGISVSISVIISFYLALVWALPF